MRRTNIYLEDRQTESLDRLAEVEGVSRAEVIRRILDRALDGTDASLAADLAAIDRSFGAAGAVELPVRGTDERARHLEGMWQES
jgi:hypothetical protein